MRNYLFMAACFVAVTLMSCDKAAVVVPSQRPITLDDAVGVWKSEKEEYKDVSCTIEKISSTQAKIIWVGKEFTATYYTATYIATWKPKGEWQVYDELFFVDKENRKSSIEFFRDSKGILYLRPHLYSDFYIKVSS